MKKQTLIFCSVITTLVLLFSCDKSELTPSKTQGLISKMILPNNSNSEVQRIFNDAQNNDYVFGIIANPNFGISKPNDIILSGKTPPGLTLKIDNSVYSAVNGQWLQTNDLFASYYGKSVNIEITQGANKISKSLYIPKIITGTKLCDNRQSINRTGNVIKWVVDDNNPMNKIAISYELYDSDDIFNGGAAYEKNIILVDDNGQYSIDDIIKETKCKRINFMLVSGNAFSFELNQKKCLFNLFTADHHEYFIR